MEQKINKLGDQIFRNVAGCKPTFSCQKTNKCKSTCEYKFNTSDWSGCNETKCGPPNEGRKKKRTVVCVAECKDGTKTSREIVSDLKCLSSDPAMVKPAIEGECTKDKINSPCVRWKTHEVCKRGKVLLANICEEEWTK